MAFQTGTRVDPRLGALDFSGFTNAANIQAQGMMNLGDAVSGAIEKYNKKKEDAINIKALGEFLDDPKLAKAVYNDEVVRSVYLNSSKDRSTSEQRNYNALIAQGVPAVEARETAFGGGSTNINVDTGQAGDIASRNVLARDQQFYVDTIEPALSSVPNIKYMEKMLNVVGDDGKVITGKLANQELFLKSLAQDIGMGEFPDVASTEAYLGTSGRLVGSVIRLFGAGTGLSDADREFAKKIAAGDITMDKEALKRLISLAKSGINNQINLFNNRIERTYQPEIVGEGVSRLGKGRLFTPNVDSLFSSENNIMQSLVTPGAGGDGAGNDLMDKAQSILDNIQ
jgi:hypothetical protein